MIKVKKLIARLEMMMQSYGEDCRVDTFSELLSVFDENMDFVQEIDISD